MGRIIDASLELPERPEMRDTLLFFQHKKTYVAPRLESTGSYRDRRIPIMKIFRLVVRATSRWAVEITSQKNGICL